MTLFGGIEAGGTKFVCAIGDSLGNIHQKTTIPTTTPDETMSQVIQFFKEINTQSPLSALGVGSFGPVDPDLTSPLFGYITTTPKLAWSHFNFLGTLKKIFNLPIGFDTDVNGAALGELKWGAGQNLDTFIYITVGTGIGGGGILRGQRMHGLIHPEMGHMLIAHDKIHDPFEGVCPFHGDCLEGLASGPAMQKRWHVDTLHELSSDHLAWNLEAEYLAKAMVNCILVLSPQKIIMGGGVMSQNHLFPKIRKKVQTLLNGYIKHDTILKNIENYIVPPALDENSGICGAIALAELSMGAL